MLKINSKPAVAGDDGRYYTKMINNVDTERYCIASTLRFPHLLADISNFIKEDDFRSKLNKTIYGSCLNSYHRQEDINEFALAAKIKNAGITFEGLDGDVLDYLTEIKGIQINEAAAINFFKDLKKLSVRRELWQTAKNLQKEMEQANDKTIDEIISISDAIYSESLNCLAGIGGNDFHNIYDDIEEVIEKIANNPPKEAGFMGPFKRVNEIYGSLLKPGNITLIGSRTGGGKSSLGGYYLNHVGYKYGVPILNQDRGEMSAFEWQLRSVCMFTGGKVSMYDLEMGLWRNNPETEKLVRAVWPMVKKIKYYYKDIGSMSAKEICADIRRFYYSVIGRGNPFIIHHDYLKSFDDAGGAPEWKQMGHFVHEIKNLIGAKGVNCPVWTSLQLNRSGIIGKKTGEQMDDTENTFTISDRITQQLTHGFLLRKKTLDELVREPNLGNSKMFNVKKRHLGRDYMAALNPVRMPDNSLQDNFIHIDSNAFAFKEMGDLATTVDKIGIITPPVDNDDAPVNL